MFGFIKRWRQRALERARLREWCAEKNDEVLHLQREVRNLSVPFKVQETCDEVRKQAKALVETIVTHQVGGAVEQARRDLREHVNALRIQEQCDAEMLSAHDKQIAVLLTEHEQLLTLLCDGFRTLGLEVVLDENGYTGVIRRAKKGRRKPTKGE